MAFTVEAFEALEVGSVVGFTDQEGLEAAFLKTIDRNPYTDEIEIFWTAPNLQSFEGVAFHEQIEEGRVRLIHEGPVVEFEEEVTE